MRLKQVTWTTIALALASPQLASAIVSDLGVSFEPIIGYERVQKLIPTPQMSSRLTYGGRVIAGITLISAEAEYTHGEESSTIGATRYDSYGDRAKVGLRSGVRFALFTASLRGGAQAAWERSVTTTGAAVSSFVRGPSYSPYAGLELRANVGSKFSGSIGAVAVFRDFSNLGNTEIQTTAGFSLRLP